MFAQSSNRPPNLAPEHWLTVQRWQVRIRADRDRDPAGAATVADLLQNLEQLEMTPEQLVSVFMALDQGGFLHARLEVQ